MAKNDMHVIIYKILTYLYECMKAGIRPEETDFCANSKLLGIPQAYWENVILEMYEKGLVKGVNTRITKDGRLVYLRDDFNITYDGVEFIVENSLMQKVREYLGSTFELVISTMVKSLI